MCEGAEDGQYTHEPKERKTSEEKEGAREGKTNKRDASWLQLKDKT